MIDIVEVEPGVFSILEGGKSYEVRLQQESVVVVDGEIFEFEREDPRQWKRGGSAVAGSGRLTMCAPMPGKVVRLLAAPGDEVQAGQGILVVEAMKMQNEMKAPRAARVVSIHVKEGDGVNGGAALAVLE